MILERDLVELGSVQFAIDEQGAMNEAYSRRKYVLAKRGIALEALPGLLSATGETLDERTLARLGDPDRPVKHLQMRVAGAICRALGIDLGDLFVFAPALSEHLQPFPADKEARLHELMELHSEGELNPLHLLELEALVDQVYDQQLVYCRRLIEHRQRLKLPPAAHPHVAAD